MATIKVTIQDDFGNVINEAASREYPLDLGKAILAEIEEAVEDFKKEALADIERDLLLATQARFSSSKFLSQALGYDGVVEAEALFSHVSQPYEQGFERQGVQIQLATATAWCSEPMPVHPDPGIAQQKCDTNKKKP